MQQQRRVGRPIGAQQGYNNQGEGGYQQQQNQGSKARFINPTIQANAIYTYLAGSQVYKGPSINCRHKIGNF